MLKKYYFLGTLIALVCSFPVLAAEGSVELPEGVTFRPHLYGHFESGQIVKGSLLAATDYIFAYPAGKYKIEHIWYEDAIVEFGFDALYREHLKLAFTIGTKLYFSFPLVEKERYTKNMRQDVYVGDLYAQYHIGDIAMPLFLGQVGYFRFKYNPECRNFGDYLFRTGTYPIWFEMGFDFPVARLLGMHAQTNLFQSLKLDLLLISATMVPAMNWSLAGLINYDVAGLHFVNIGAGIEGANLFSVHNDHEFPNFGGDLTTPKNGNINYRYLTENGDTAWYTFKGTKLMGRISIDPKVFFPGNEIFGENDLKLYAEADIIGLKSYPDSGLSGANVMQHIAPSYNEIWQKMPVAVGFNFPTFKLLDVLNGELEWFGAQYYNDASNLVNAGSAPLPMYAPDFWDQTLNPRKGFLKWSVYAKKSFLGGRFAITGQIGRDHMRLPCAAYGYEMWHELLIEANDWSWNLKTSWMF